MAKELRFINQNDEYAIIDGGSADRQILMIGDEIQEAYISHSIHVSENGSDNLFMKFKPSNHSYYTLINGSYSVEMMNGSEEACMAKSLPCYLTGWQTENGEEALLGGNTLDTEIINTYYYGGAETNLNLYAKWGETKFLRIIVSTFSSENVVNYGSYIVTVNDSSYEGADVFRLSSLFKQTVDKSNVFRHLILKRNGTEDSHMSEVGVGDACPIQIEGVRYPSYFGFKSGDDLSVQITITNPEYIPEYSLNPNNNLIGYNGYICDEGLSRDFNDKGVTVPLDVSNNSVWSCTINNTLSDKTLFIPLVPKPVIDLSISPSGTGTVLCNEKYMPGDVCTLTIIPTPGYIIDEVHVNGTIISAPYSFTVLGNTIVEAVFAQAIYT